MNAYNTNWIRTCLILLFTFMSAAATAQTKTLSDFSRIDRDAEEVVVSNKVIEIPDFAFAGCTRLRKVVFETGSRCRSIGDNAFYRCDSLRAVVLPPTLRRIGRYAFAWCPVLEDINLTDVHEIGAHAFAYCFALREVCFSSRLASIGNNAFCRCDALTYISLPPAVREVGSYAFAGCTSLRKASLPANSHMLGELIFSGCDSLQIIEAPSSRPPAFDCGSYIFDPDEADRHASCRLIVPPGSENAYRTSPGWLLFHDISSHDTQNTFGESTGNN